MKSILFLALSIYFVSCSNAQDIAFDEELVKLKDLARKELNHHVNAFNQYEDRPDSDGPFNRDNNEVFLQQNIPLFISSNGQIGKVYNYRWWMISKHLKAYLDPIDDTQYWVVTEFFGVKPWASLSGAIPCPAGHQFYDVRWLRDPQYLRSYADYFMKGSASQLDQRENANFLTYKSRPESHHFSSWMIDGVGAFLKIHPDHTWLYNILPHMEKHQQVWDSLFTVNNPTARTDGMYKILDLYDGMEFSLSAVLGLIASEGAYSLYNDENWKTYYLGWSTTANAANSSQAREYPNAFRKGYPDFYLVRPSINGYAYGNLKALADLHELIEEQDPSYYRDKVARYNAKASSLKEKILNVLWNDEDQFFHTYSAGDNEFGVRDFEARVRESVGYTPWYFNMIPKEESNKYAKAWEMFASPNGFYNTQGMATAERQHPYFNEQAYAWNGRGWPFQNSVVYKAYANYLRNYKETISDPDRALLYDYIEKLAFMHGEDQLNIGEWYIPTDGKEFGGEKDYFHSTFPDIVIEDLIGFESSHERRFSIHPLLPQHEWDYFYLGNIRYHGHDIDIVWKKDWDDSKHGDQSMLCVWVDGELVAKSPSLNTKMDVNLK